MNLKKSDQALLDQLQSFAATLEQNELSFDKIKESLRPLLDNFEKETGAKASLRQEAGKVVVSAFDLNRDDVRTISNKDKSLVSLKARMLGVSIDIKVVKQGIAFTNGQIAESLLETAALIGKMSEQMSDYPESDWNRETGEIVLKRDDSPDDNEEDGEGGEGVGDDVYDAPIEARYDKGAVGDPLETNTQEPGAFGNAAAHVESQSFRPGDPIIESNEGFSANSPDRFE